MTDEPTPAPRDRDTLSHVERAAAGLRPPSRPTPAPESGLQPPFAQPSRRDEASPAGTPGAAPTPVQRSDEEAAILAQALDRHGAIVPLVVDVLDGKLIGLSWPGWIPEGLRETVRRGHFDGMRSWVELALGLRRYAGVPVRIGFDAVPPVGGLVAVVSPRPCPRLLCAGLYVPITKRSRAVVITWPADVRGRVCYVHPPEAADGEWRATIAETTDDVSRQPRTCVTPPPMVWRKGDRVRIVDGIGEMARGTVVSMRFDLEDRAKPWTVLVRVGRRTVRRVPDVLVGDLELPAAARMEGA